MFKLFKSVYLYKTDTQQVLQTWLRPAKEVKTRWMTLEKTGALLISKDYAWNGSTPSVSVLDWFIIGTPDGIIDYQTGKPKLYYPTLVHDALTQFYKELDAVGISTKDIDGEFYRLMRIEKFSLSWLYYKVVRLASKMKGRK